jgi:drug/metabolite transporter (DMT)-like permease
LNLARGYPVALLSAAILSTTAIFIRYLTQTYAIPPLVLAFWRDSFVAMTLLLVFIGFCPALLGVSRSHIRYLIGYGLVLAVFNALWTMSVALNGAAVSTVLAYSSGAFTAMLGWWLLKERLSWVKVLAVTLSLAGCFLVSEAINAEAWRSNLIGILTGLLSGLLYAFYSLMGRRAAQKGLNPWTTVLYTFGIAAGFLFIFNLFPSGQVLPAGMPPTTAGSLADFFWLGTAWSGWLILFLLAAGPTVLGFGLYNVSLGYLPSSVANLILTLEPVFTAVIAYALLDERMKAVQIAGSLLIVTGIIILRVYEGREASQNLPEPNPEKEMSHV